MNIFPDKGRIRLMVVACGLMLLSACATSTSMSPESQVEERATARWEAFFSGDLAGAYEYLTPAYRTSVSSLAYQRSVLLKRVARTSAKYVESACEESLCKVKFDVGFTVSGALPGVKSYKGTQKIEESWVLIDGQWYFVPPS
jgi:hypothetical protein